MPALLKVLPIYVAGRVVLAATLLLPVVGAIVYHRIAFGVRSHWPLVAAMAAYNALFILGFMNFLLSLGMALLAAAGWLRWREKHPAWVAMLGALVTVAIFFMHLFGLVFLAVLLGCEELVTHWRTWRTAGAGWPRQFRRLGMAVIGFTPPIVPCVIAPLDHLDNGVIYCPMWRRLYGLLEPFLAYDGFVDGLTGGVFLAGLFLTWRYRRLRIAPGMALALAILFVGCLICPSAAKQIAFIDACFPIMLGLLLFAGLRPTGLSHRARIGIAAVLALVFLARTASLADVWHDHNRDLAEFRQVIAPVEPGARVLVVSVDPENAPDHWAGVPRGRRIPAFFRLDFHLPALLTIERRALIPYLFTVAAKQPLGVRQPFDRIAVPEGQPPDWQSLVVGDDVHPVMPTPYLADWRRGYDYVLLLNAGGAGSLDHFLPHVLQLVTARDLAALYRIQRK